MSRLGFLPSGDWKPKVLAHDLWPHLNQRHLHDKGLNWVRWSQHPTMDVAELSPWIKRIHTFHVMHPGNYSMPLGCQGRQWLLVSQLPPDLSSFLIRLQSVGVDRITWALQERYLCVQHIKGSWWRSINLEIEEHKCQQGLKHKAKESLTLILGLLKVSLHLASRALCSEPPLTSNPHPLGFPSTPFPTPYFFPSCFPPNMYHPPAQTAWLLIKRQLMANVT